MDTPANRRAFRIGLTGGIASGKTTVADQFAELGVPVIDTDLIAREVVAAGAPALDEIRVEFGGGVFGADGLLDRSRLRQVVFADESRRQALERILHPRIRETAMARVAAADAPYVIVVVPLLVESPMRDEMDRVLVVDCDEATQLERLKARDGDDGEQARRILAAQASRDERLAIADDVLLNDGAPDDLPGKVRALHHAYLELAAGDA